MALPALRIGLVGLDTSHSVAFTKCFNKTGDPEHVPGGRVVAGFPGGSADFELSAGRVAGFTKKLQEEYDVKIMGSPAEVAGACDLLVLGSCDGRVHRRHFEETVGYHRPTFIDKPVAVSSADAKAIFDLAAKENVPVMSCSALRYAENLVKALEGGEGPVLGFDTFGPMAEEPTQPGLFWYGVHQVEMVQRAMGNGCAEVRATRNDDGDLITCLYADGRMASMRGLRKGHHKFGAVIHREKGFQFVDVSGGKRSYYAGMLDAMMATLPARKTDVRPEETMEIIKIIEAANESRKSGKPVPVA
jgi:predicted dehydrogenase